jgi:predicted ribosome quality control (RQC) complex YloA/Tae2 family protein
MSFDGLFTYAMTNELSLALKGGRINKIQQPFPNELLIVIRANGKNQRLLLSAHPNYARVQLTNEVYENPSEPPMFCMLMRKHLEGFILEDIRQIELDRIIIFEIKGRNELGDLSYKQLIVEIMGRHSNIILVDKDRNMILDSIKHVSYAVNTHRAILPGQAYIEPPKQNKLSPFGVTEEDVLRNLDFNAGKMEQQLVQSFAGISPLFAKEVLYKAGIPHQVTLPQTFLSQLKNIQTHDYSPAITSGNGKEFYYLFPLKHVGESSTTFPTLSELLDRYYFGKAGKDRVKQQATDLLRFIMNEKDKNEKKIGKLVSTLEDAEKASRFQLYGELLTANLYAIQRGMKEVEVVNYYDETGATVTIPLDPQKTPSDTAQKYFTKYQKAKNALQVVQEQIEMAKEEVTYFESLLQQVETASPKDIEGIREELIEGGYIRDRRKKQLKKSTSTKPILDHYFSTDGTEIIVGKNNKQNDYLTNKLAARDEIWLHTKDIPGSHVVIRSKSPQEQTIIEAASLAAYYSKARQSSSVPVDFTLVRHVKKPSGAKPGFVIYDHQQTVYVTPSEEIVLALKNK